MEQKTIQKLKQNIRYPQTDWIIIDKRKEMIKITL